MGLSEKEKTWRLIKIGLSEGENRRKLIKMQLSVE